MSKGRRTSGRRRAAGAPSKTSASLAGGASLTPKPELIVVAYPGADLRVRGSEVASRAGAEVGAIASILSSADVVMYPLFGVAEDRLKARASAMREATDTAPPDLSVFYKVEAPAQRLEEIAARLREQEAIEAAFIKPAAQLPRVINNMAPAAEAPPAATPDFTPRQQYLNAAPVGIDARFAWTVNGGRGAGVNIIDVEGEWRFSHEDLLQNQGGVVGGTPPQDIDWRNHGTAVVSVFGGDRNAFGVTGICPDANVRAISVFPNIASWGTAAAIRQAADTLNAGDIILLELHRPGPRFNFELRQDQLGFIAIEWWPDDMCAIQYAISRGIIVVEAGGNGAENLDDAIYDENPASPQGPFPSWWRNPFRRSPIDTGAIVVGAGAPPPGTHGNDYGADRSRLDFSNYGTMFDAQGWGREVTACGYGDLQGGDNEDLWYTDEFSGTSSASPIVVGALGCAQGALRAAGKPTLTPARARSLLRANGSPQQDGPNGPSSQRIGSRPNLRQMITSLVSVPAAGEESKAVNVSGSDNAGAVIINISGDVTIHIGAGKVTTD